MTRSGASIVIVVGSTAGCKRWSGTRKPSVRSQISETSAAVRFGRSRLLASGIAHSDRASVLASLCPLFCFSVVEFVRIPSSDELGYRPIQRTVDCQYQFRGSRSDAGFAVTFAHGRPTG